MADVKHRPPSCDPNSCSTEHAPGVGYLGFRCPSIDLGQFGGVCDEFGDEIADEISDEIFADELRNP